MCSRGRNWPGDTRHTKPTRPSFVEGLEPDEIGMVLGLSAQAANELLGSIRRRVRATLLDQSAL